MGEEVIGLKQALETGKDYYEIRLESIGGLGANLCGKMLGELGLKYLGLNSTNFSSYGSEKTGTPVKGFIRYCKKENEIRVHYPVVCPDLLVIFHQALLKDESVYKGCTENTIVIVALEPGQEEVAFQGKGICYGLEAQKIAMETHSRIPREFHGQRSLGIDSPTLCSTLASKELDVTESTNRGLEVLELIPCFWFYI